MKGHITNSIMMCIIYCLSALQLYLSKSTSEAFTLRSPLIRTRKIQIKQQSCIRSRTSATFTQQGYNSIGPIQSLSSFSRNKRTICHYSNNIDEENDDVRAANDGKYNNNSTSLPSSSNLFFADEECYDLCNDMTKINDQDIKNEIDGDDISDEFKSKTNILSDEINKQLKKQQRQKNTNSNKISSEGTTTQKDETIKSTNQVRTNLELRWSIDENNVDRDLEDITSCSEPCLTCRGQGILICEFCNGDGYIDFGFAEKGTMGERLLKNPNGRLGVECPVCDDNGEQSCGTCRGSGWIARWRLNNNNSINDLHP